MNRAFILLNLSDREKQSQGKEILSELLKRKPPIADLEILHAIDASESSLERQGFLQTSKFWERAAGGGKNAENICEAWFNGRYRRGDYKGAQQVCVPRTTRFRRQSSKCFRQHWPG